MGMCGNEDPGRQRTINERAHPARDAERNSTSSAPTREAREPRDAGLGATRHAARPRIARALIAMLLAVVVAGIQPPANAAAVTGVVAYHGASASTHTSKTGTLTAQGYRPISLSLYGTSTSPRYAAVWVKRAGPAFRMMAATTEASYNATVTAWKAEGYRPEILSGNGTRIAGVFVKDSTPWVQVPAGSTRATFDAKNAASKGYVLRAAAFYGTATTPRYAGVWVKQTLVSAVVSFGGATSTAFTATLAAYGRNGQRPRLVARMTSGNFFALVTDDSVGPWSGAHELTTAQYESRFSTENAAGNYPISIAGSGSGTATRYTVIFAKRDLALPRQWHATGTAIASLIGFDDYMRALMNNTGARAGALSIVRNGKLIYSRGFTNGEAGYAETQPTTLFRIASCSKPITSLAFFDMVDDGKIALVTKVQSALNLTTPSGAAPVDDRFVSISANYILYPRGGWNRKVSGDPMVADAKVNAAFGGTLPVTKLEIARYMAGRNLDFAPGSAEAYSNFGFSLLGQVMEKRDGKTFQQLVRDRIMTPLGLTRPRIGTSAVPSSPNGEVRYEDATPSLHTTVLNATGAKVSAPYGGFNLTNMDANGAWVMGAPDYAKILAALDQPTNPLITKASRDAMWTAYTGTNTLRGWFQTSLPNPTGLNLVTRWHNGSLDGTSCLVFKRTDGLSMVVLLNRNIPGFFQPNPHMRDLNTIANQVTTWPTTDLFPSVGIPSF